MASDLAPPAEDLVKPRREAVLRLNHEHSEPPPLWRSPAGLTLLVAAAVGGFLLFTEHRAHVLRVLPYAVLLAYPLMHMLMHQGHHHGGHSHSERGNDERR